MSKRCTQGTTTVHVLHVEDDEFQQMAMRMVATTIANAGGINIELTTVDTAAKAVAATQRNDPGAPAFDLVMLDVMLPGGNGDTVLPTLRSQCGQFCAIIMLSASSQESSMQHCWLDLGADSYRIKPISAHTVEELLGYALEKRRLLQKRRRNVSPDHDDEDDDGAFPAKRDGSFRAKKNGTGVGSSPEATSAARETEEAPAIVDLISNGRRGPVHLAFDEQNKPVAMKVYPAGAVRGPPPRLADLPLLHPHVNRVLRRLTCGAQCVELRELCEGGEFFDQLVEVELSVEEAYGWFSQLVSAVAFCHAHGVAHGQLHPENVLLNADSSAICVTGFSLPMHGDGAERDAKRGMAGTGDVDVSACEARADIATWQVPSGSATVSSVRVALRSYHAELDAPELRGRHDAAMSEVRTERSLSCPLSLSSCPAAFGTRAP